MSEVCVPWQTGMDHGGTKFDTGRCSIQYLRVCNSEIYSIYQAKRPKGGSEPIASSMAKRSVAHGHEA